MPNTCTGWALALREIAALDGDLVKAAFLVGYVDEHLGSFSGGRQITEQRQLDGILANISAGGMDGEKLARLRAQGALMSAFEA